MNDAGGFYLVRGTKSLNPKINPRPRRGDRRKYPSWRDYLERGRTATLWAEVLDMVVKPARSSTG